MSNLEKKQRNDVLIKELCSDKNYNILKTGTILTLRALNGVLSVKGIWRPLALEVCSEGYCRVRYQAKYLNLHRIIYQKFIGDLNPSLEINHIDGNPSNNNVENLELVTRSENMLHSFRVLKKLKNRPPEGEAV